MTARPSEPVDAGTATEQSRHPGKEAARSLRVPIARPSFTTAEADAVREPLESGWVVQGPRVAEFEQRFADHIGAEHAVATTSCTTALHLAVAILDLQPGDEVVVPAYTWVSSANVVEYMGATPRFCDVELDTFNANAAAIESAVTETTVGIIPVHLFGLCAEMGPIGELAASRKLWTVEDAACAFGAWQDGTHAGTFGDIGAFSFHPRKSITTGEGGMLITANPEWDEAARSLREHGAGRSDLSRHEQEGGFLLSAFPRLGYNYRMTDLQGALGCAQMDRADWILDQRRARAVRYEELLAEFDWLRTPVTPEGNVHGFQSYVCLFAPEEPTLKNLDRLSAARDRLMAAMERAGVATRQGTHAAALTEFYAGKYGLDRERFPNAAIAEGLSLALPLFPDLTDDEQELVVTELGRAFEAL